MAEYPVTHQLLDEASNASGGYTKRQIEALGLTWPLRKGWKSALLNSGLVLSQEQYDLLMWDSHRNGKAVNNKEVKGETTNERESDLRTVR